jgi:hypothetical protein
MSLLVKNNDIHLIGNIANHIDEHVILPFLNVFSMIEDTGYNTINLHVSGRGSFVDISPIVDVIKQTKKLVNIYIENSELIGGYNGVDGNLRSLLEIENVSVVDNTRNEYNPPLDAAIAEVHITREMEVYREDA